MSICHDMFNMTKDKTYGDIFEEDISMMLHHVFLVCLTCLQTCLKTCLLLLEPLEDMTSKDISNYAPLVVRKYHHHWKPIISSIAPLFFKAILKHTKSIEHAIVFLIELVIAREYITIIKTIHHAITLVVYNSHLPQKLERFLKHLTSYFP